MAAIPCKGRRVCAHGFFRGECLAGAANVLPKQLGFELFVDQPAFGFLEGLRSDGHSFAVTASWQRLSTVSVFLTVLIWTD